MKETRKKLALENLALVLVVFIAGIFLFRAVYLRLFAFSLLCAYTAWSSWALLFFPFETWKKDKEN